MGGERPLVAFTILGQAAVGLYLGAGVPLYLFHEGGAGRGARLALVLAALGLMAGASALSFLHLHHPARAFRALANVGSSWLSREILFELAFIGALALDGFCEWRGLGGPALAKALFALSGLAGMMFVGAMARLYMLPAIPAWRSFYTPASFALSAAVLGTSAAAVFFRMSPPASAWSRALLGASVVSVAASFGGALLFAPGHGLRGGRPGPSLRPRGAACAPLHALRLASLAAGSALLAAGLSVRSAGGGGTGVPAVFIVGGFVLAAAGEVLGRILFYGVGPQQDTENK
ncbi:MAG TPA: DmsC/YnfH family molybdoenzyme membrane anchor subunit [Terriglobales bacterium]|nr:DmsC/YnfH family molybdoenzyme membrane anchor subunit [Terriglobales bacterium]